MELLDLLGEDLLSFCSESSDEYDIDQLFFSAFELCDREQSIVSPAPGSPTRPYRQAKPTADSPTPGFKEQFARPKTEGDSRSQTQRCAEENTRWHTILHKCVGCMVQLSPKDVWR